MKRLRVISTIFFLMLLFTFMSNPFAQINWTKHGSPVLLAGSPGEWDDDGLGMPCIIYDGITYKIWYSGFDGTTWRIGYATSPDGINWTKYDDPSTTNPPYAESDPVINIGPGAWENSWVYGSMVHFDGTAYRMWYAGTDGNHDRVGYATSTDGGITWEKDDTHNPVINLGSSGSWDDASVDPGPINFNGSTFEMIYNGFDGLHYQGGYATSPDGISWTKSADPILLYGQPGSWDNPRVQPNSVVYNSYTSKYYLFYSGGVLLDWRIGYATASDFSGLWTKSPSILLDVTPGSFDSDVIAFPYAIYDSTSNIYKMWYLGGSSASVGAIGYATAPRITSVEEERFDEIPTDFTLSQNYPNPFNPSTKIMYSVPQSSNVIIKVFDILGNEIETLINEEKPLGTYELTWTASTLPSGVYFYRLIAGDFTSTKKMLLLK
jgi:hypothetical protein